MNGLVPDFRQELGEPANPKARFRPDLARVRFQISFEDSKERRFPRAIAADERDSLAGLERQLGASKNGLIADVEREAGEGEDRHGER